MKWNKKFVEAVEFVLSNDSIYIENIADLGSTKNFGISLRFYQQFISKDANLETIKNLFRYDAIEIYYNHFWITAYESIISQAIVERVLDCAIIVGIGNANKILQRSVWGCTGNMLKPIDDGVIDHETLHQVNYFGSNLLFPFRVERSAFHRLLAEKNPDLGKCLDDILVRTYK